MPTPLENPDVKLSQYPEFKLPAKEAVDKIINAIRETCFKHGLVTMKNGGNDAL